MTREEYLAYRTKGSIEPLYEYYREHYKGDNPIDPQTFFTAIAHWPFIHEAMEKATTEYDIKFEVTKIQELKTGKILKYL